MTLLHEESSFSSNAVEVRTSIHESITAAQTLAHPLVDQAMADGWLTKMDARVDLEVKRQTKTFCDNLIEKQLLGQEPELRERVKVAFIVRTGDVRDIFKRHDGTFDWLTMRISLEPLGRAAPAPGKL